VIVKSEKIQGTLEIFVWHCRRVPWSIFCQGAGDTSSAGRFHEVLAKVLIFLFFAEEYVTLRIVAC
jgi:hypothetical protein